jgi:hypothetical protein
MDDFKKVCTVDEGKFVRPCHWLEKATDDRGSGGRERGLRMFDYTVKAKPSRTFWAIKSAEFPKALAIDFCPFCGTNISAPFKDDAP